MKPLSYIRNHYRWVIPVLLFLFFTPFSSDIDLTVSKHFYLQNSEGVYTFQESKFINFLYNYGEWPAFVVGAVASFLWLVSFKSKKLIKWRPAFLHLTLTLILAAGLITNGLLKEYWGRPRPRQTVEFGGQNEFRSWYNYDFTHHDEGLKSFPSGHAIMGFYFLAFVPIGQFYRKHWLIWFGLLAGLGLGGLLSFARIAQGGHFFTDTLVSGLVAWFCTLIIAWFVFGKGKKLPLSQ